MITNVTGGLTQAVAPVIMAERLWGQPEARDHAASQGYVPLCEQRRGRAAGGLASRCSARTRWGSPGSRERAAARAAAARPACDRAVPAPALAAPSLQSHRPGPAAAATAGPSAPARAAQ